MARMYGEDPIDQNHPVQITLTQLLIVVATVMIALVLPAQLFIYYTQGNQQSPYSLSAVTEKQEPIITSTGSSTSSAPPSTPQVAGIQTEKRSLISIPGTNLVVNLNSEIGLLILAGTVIVALALIVAIYLLITHNPSNKKQEARSRN